MQARALVLGGSLRRKPVAQNPTDLFTPKCGAAELWTNKRAGRDLGLECGDWASSIQDSAAYRLLAGEWKEEKGGSHKYAQMRS
jgi:hypothetical protein